MNELIKLSNLPQNKEEISDFVKAVINQIKEGNADALEVKAKATIIKKTMEAIDGDKELNSWAVDEFGRHGEKQVRAYGVGYEQRELGVKYNYSNSGCSELDEINAKIEELNERRKEIENTLKNLTDGGLADPDTGEMWRRPTKTSTTKVIVKL